MPKLLPMLRSITSVFLLLCFQLFFFQISGLNAIYAQSEQQETEWLKHIQSGESKKLGVYFAPMINLELPNITGDYNKNQAVMLLADFFSAHPAKKVIIKQSGHSSQLKLFYIGEYVCTDQTMMLFINTHTSNNKQIIHSLSIKKK